MGIPVAISANSSTPARIMGPSRLDEAAQLIDTTQERWAEPEMHRLRAELLLSISEYTAVEVSHRHVLSLARRQNNKLWSFGSPSDSPIFGRIKASAPSP